MISANINLNELIATIAASIAALLSGFGGLGGL